MSSRSLLALLCVVLKLDPMDARVDPMDAQTCTNAGSWRFTSESNLPLLGCADDPDWRRRHVATGDCAWIGELPGSRCDDKDENGIKAKEACGCACGPTAAPSVDPVVYDCAWVGENSTARCGSVSELKAEDACPKTCGDGTKDSGTWYLGEIHKNCLWVGENPDKVEKRCDKMGEDPAVAACALTCDAACALTTAPTTLGFEAFGDDEVLCEDDAVWSSKKGDCTWVAKNPDSRCSQAGYVIKGKDACLETCGTGDEDSESWFFRKANKNCAWIGKQNANKIAKLCKKSGTDGNACPATCDECPDGDDDEDGDCADDASWHVAGDEGKDCAWVSGNSNRCGRTGEDDRVASEACPVSCDACPGGEMVCGEYNLFDAVVAYFDDADAAEATYEGPIGDWDVSCVTNTMSMFDSDPDYGGNAGAATFNADISGWDVSSVTMMKYMFYQAFEFNAAIDAWDVSSVTNMHATFAHAFEFNGAIDAWDVSSVTSMQSMFFDAEKFNGAIDAWDVSSVTIMESMFHDAYEFDQNLEWCVGTSVNTDNAFDGSDCEATSCGVTQGDWLEDAVAEYLADADAAEATYGGPIGEWDVSCVTDMFRMFYQANVFNGAIDAWDVSSVTNMYYMFGGANEFNAAIDAWDVSSVTKMEYMFVQAHEFNAAIDAWDVSSVTYMKMMFYHADEFNGAIDAWDVSSVINMYKMFNGAEAFNGAIGAWDVSSVTIMSTMFHDAIEFNAAIDAWDVSSVTALTGMNGMFYQAYEFNAAIDAWDVSSVTDMFGMFVNAEAFNAAIDAWDVSSVTNMEQMFYHAYEFNAAIGGWDVSSVTNMYFMFQFADAFNGAIDAWDVSSVTNMYGMFHHAKAFNGAIDAWDVSFVTSMNGMFYYAIEFDQDLNWCVGTDVTAVYAFTGAACAATSCGVTQGDCDSEPLDPPSPEPSEAPTSELSEAPTSEPSEAPTMAPTKCENDDEWYTKKSKRDCNWVERKNVKKDWDKKKANKICKKKSDDGTKAFDACGCDACDKSRFEDADQSAANVAIFVPCALVGVLLVGAAVFLLRRRLVKTLQHRRCSMPVVSHSIALEDDR